MYAHVSTCIKCLMYKQSMNHISFNIIVIHCTGRVTVNMHQVFIHQVSFSPLFPTCLSPAPCRSYIDPPLRTSSQQYSPLTIHRRRSQSSWSGFGRTTFFGDLIKFIIKIVSTFHASLFQLDHFKSPSYAPAIVAASNRYCTGHIAGLVRVN